MSPDHQFIGGNLTLYTDTYALTMMRGFLRAGRAAVRGCFDLYFRKNPFGNGYTVAAGLEQALEYLEDLHFAAEDIEFLQAMGLGGDPEFEDALRRFRFTGDVHAIPEGTPVFPDEPLIRLQARLFEAPLVEAALLSILGHQSLIATKASRIVRSAEGRPVFAFGARRAQGLGAGVYGDRAAIIGGCAGTSNVLVARRFPGARLIGTHAHAWILSFGSEIEAFREWGNAFPDNLVFLVDTYNVLRSGVPNAIRVFREVRERLGRNPKVYGIRLDSGDLAYLSREAHRMMSGAGFPDAQIVVTNDLDEKLIQQLVLQGAHFTAVGAGTKLITAYDQPALGTVYKLAGLWEDGLKWSPRIKVSENAEKVTTPEPKRVVRLFHPSTGEASADLIMRADEDLPGEPFTIFDPVHTWKRKWVAPEGAEDLLVPVIQGGKRVYESPSLTEIAAQTQRNLKRFAPEHLRLMNPHAYHVDLSERLWRIKGDGLNAASAQILDMERPSP